jgi:hypothetical protein
MIEIQQENKIDTATATVIRKFVVNSKTQDEGENFRPASCSHNRKYVSIQLRKTICNKHEKQISMV